MKALTLTQPWATAIVLGYKSIETRSWRTNYRGPLAIHAAKGVPIEAKMFAAEEHALGRLQVTGLPIGAVIAMARLTDCVPTEEIRDQLCGLERRYGDYAFGRWAWVLKDIEPLPEPIPARGALGLWDWPRR